MGLVEFCTGDCEEMTSTREAEESPVRPLSEKGW
jgi:hypothetical protein